MSSYDPAVWLSYARADLEVAHVTLEASGLYARHVCFWSQQAAEKALKALLLAHGIAIPRTHDLDHLRELVPPGAAIKAEFPQLYSLTVWAVESRYPARLDDDASLDEAHAALDLAGRLVRAVERDMPSGGTGAS